MPRGNTRDQRLGMGFMPDLYVFPPVHFAIILWHRNGEKKRKGRGTSEKAEINANLGRDADAKRRVERMHRRIRVASAGKIRRGVKFEKRARFQASPAPCSLGRASECKRPHARTRIRVGTCEVHIRYMRITLPVHTPRCCGGRSYAEGPMKRVLHERGLLSVLPGRSRCPSGKDYRFFLPRSPPPAG